MLIYIHGFASSKNSSKAQILKKHIKDFVSVDLAHEAHLAIHQIETLIASHQNETITLIGSSLGGFYATYLAEKHQLKAILVNPSTQPFNTLTVYLNQEVKNYSNETSFFHEQKHLDAYREFITTDITPSRYLLLLQKGDESLDYTLAEQKYKGAQMIIQDGGSHAFDNFESMLGLIESFRV